MRQVHAASAAGPGPAGGPGFCLHGGDADGHRPGHGGTGVPGAGGMAARPSCSGLRLPVGQALCLEAAAALGLLHHYICLQPADRRPDAAGAGGDCPDGPGLGPHPAGHGPPAAAGLSGGGPAAAAGKPGGHRHHRLHLPAVPAHDGDLWGPVRLCGALAAAGAAPETPGRPPTGLHLSGYGDAPAARLLPGLLPGSGRA